MRYRIPSVVLALVLVVGINPGIALAGLLVTPADYTGARSTASGTIVANNRWSGDGNHGFRFAWEIADPLSTGSGLWEYTYTISGVLAQNGAATSLSQDLSHLIVEISDLEAIGREFSESFLNFNNGDYLDGGEPMVDTYSPGTPSNPGLPDDLHGIKWEPGTDTGSYEIYFQSTQAPIWGSFYAKTGRDTAAWNLGLDPASGYSPDVQPNELIGWVPTPDSISVPPPPGGGGEGDPHTPEPATVVLLGAGAALLLRRRKTRRHSA